MASTSSTNHQARTAHGALFARLLGPFETHRTAATSGTSAHLASPMGARLSDARRRVSLVCVSVMIPIMVAGRALTCCTNSSNAQASRFFKSCQQAGLNGDCCRLGSVMLCTECAPHKTPRPVCASSCEAWQSACGNFWVDSTSSVQDGLEPCTDDSIVCAKLLTIAHSRGIQAEHPDTRICALAGIPFVDDDTSNCLGPRTAGARAKRPDVSRAGRQAAPTAGGAAGWGPDVDRVLWL